MNQAQRKGKTWIWAGVGLALALAFAVQWVVVRTWLHKASNTKVAPAAAESGAVKQAVEQVLSIQLGEPLHENGLQLVVQNDGQSSPAVMEGEPCHGLLASDEAYLYFRVEPSFKKPEPMDVQVVVEYFDSSHGKLDLQYDAWSPNGQNEGQYTACRNKVALKNSRRWETAVFSLPEARLSNRQNGKADFRLRISQPDVYIKRVLLQYDTTLSQNGLYTRSNEVSMVFGSTNLFSGLAQAFDPDSVTSPAIAGDQDCLAVNIRPKGPGYLYAKVDPSFKVMPSDYYQLQVEFFSEGPYRFRVHYDGKLNTPNYKAPYTPCEVKSGPGGQWQKATFRIQNPRFRNSQNGDADFRVQVFTPEFFVRSVQLTREGN